jgi:phosphoribosylaminoimidazolecarboxamide formyltransferase/IMP cyclohydrolase
VKRRALISVYNKQGIVQLAKFLADSEWEILSTGGTAKNLRENGIAVTDVSAVTGFPECLDGRVKTLHPAIHAGLLAKRDEKSHMDTLAKLGLAPIDLVCVNLYPFFEKVQEDLPLDETVEFIDIGGPTMLRAAAKNFHDVLVVTDPADYETVMDGLRAGSVDLATRKRLAGKVFNLTSAYDAAIAAYLLDKPDDVYPAFWTRSYKKAQGLRYGENSHQTAALYERADELGAISAMRQLNGKELSYNNLRDLDLAWKAACSFGLFADGNVYAPSAAADIDRVLDPNRAATGAQICCAAIKHNSPCGIATAGSLEAAFDKAYACDPVSIFGGIIACNTTVDVATAAKIADLFVEIVAAPDFTTRALDILRKKKNVRVMKAPLPPQDELDCIGVDGGLLVQSTNNRLLDKWEVVTKKVPEERDIDDMLFGLQAVAWAKSNAIVVVKDRAAVGTGAGQTNRIDAAQEALERAALAVKNAKDGVFGNREAPRVLASDAFFPFSDCVEAAAKAGVKVIIQPGGSLKDKESIEACDRLGLAMVFTGLRHFKH